MFFRLIFGKLNLVLVKHIGYLAVIISRVTCTANLGFEFQKNVGWLHLEAIFENQSCFENTDNFITLIDRKV